MVTGRVQNLQKTSQGVKQAVNLVEAMEKDLVMDSCPKSGDNCPLDEDNDVLMVMSRNEVEKQKADLEMAQNDKKGLKKELARALEIIDQQKSKLIFQNTVPKKERKFGLEIVSSLAMFYMIGILLGLYIASFQIKTTQSDLDICQQNGKVQKVEIEDLKWKLEIMNQDMDKTIPMTKTLLGKHINAKDDSGNTELCIASRDGHFGYAEILIKLGANVRAECPKRQTPLHFAADRGHVKITQLLIQNGGDVNAMDVGGMTPLHTAVFRGKLEVARLLIQNGADVNAKTLVFKHSPLHIAAAHRYPKVAELLLKHGANKDLKNKYDETPLETAERNRKGGDFYDVEAILQQN